MMKVKLIQDYPLRYAGILYQPEAEFDAADGHAAALVNQKRVAAIKTEPSPAERKAALKAAIIELQKENPDKVPSVDKIKAKSGFAIKAEERDALIAEMNDEEGE